MAGVTIVSLPVIVAYVIFQRWIVRGIAMTGLAN
jgi:multiple sugar transport system permease protein